MNKIWLTGRITKDLELRSTKNGTDVCEFTIAVNRPTSRDGEQKADFVNCVVYGTQAKNFSKYQKKGNLIAVLGEYRVDSWQKEDKWYNKNYVLVNSIEYLQKAEEKNPYQEFGEEHPELEMPF